MIVAQTCKRAFQRRETVRVHGLEVGPVMKPDRTNDRADPEHVLFLLRLFLDVSHCSHAASRASDGGPDLAFRTSRSSMACESMLTN